MILTSCRLILIVCLQYLTFWRMKLHYRLDLDKLKTNIFRFATIWKVSEKFYKMLFTNCVPKVIFVRCVTHSFKIPRSSICKCIQAQSAKRCSFCFNLQKFELTWFASVVPGVGPNHIVTIPFNPAKFRTNSFLFDLARIETNIVCFCFDPAGDWTLFSLRSCLNKG